MRRRRVVIVLAASTALWCATLLAVTGAAQAAVARVSVWGVARAGGWGKAIEVPGTGALNKGGNAFVNSVSCASAGNCAAVGPYTDRSGHHQAFVASERNGVWHAAIELPGTGALNKGDADVLSVSCASAGNCAAGGLYTDASGHSQAFVASERYGAWHAAIEVPGMGALNKGGDALVHSLSCASAGNCAAGGSYDDGSKQQAFVASERNGAWHAAIEVPGTGTLNTGSIAAVDSVSCASAGSCLAGGFIVVDRSGHQLGFVASERNGVWHAAIEVPGMALNRGRVADVFSVSCASAGNCAAGGFYADGSGHQHAFVASERNGSWHAAIEVPGTGQLAKGGSAYTYSVSCASAGNCAAGGFYVDRPGHTQAFVASERNSAWHAAIEVPGTGALNKGGDAVVYSVSCASAGNCAAGGFYSDGSGHGQVLVDSERNGVWHAAIKVPGSAALNKSGSAGVLSVSCASAGSCAAGGPYTDSRHHTQAFVVSRT